MIRRLEHWLQVLPPVEGADVKLMNPVQARQFCTSVDADVPATASPPLQVDCLQTSSSTDADADVHHPVDEKVSDKDIAVALQRSQDDSIETPLLPDFPLLPVSRGFQMKLQKLLTQFNATLTASGITAFRSSSLS